MNKIEFKTSNGKFVLQLLSNNVTDIELRELGNNIVVFYKPSDEYTEYPFIHQGYKPQCEIIGLVSELIEEQCQEVVDYRQRIFFYPDYTHFIQPNYFYSFAISSFKSLCESLNVDLTQNWLLIKLL